MTNTIDPTMGFVTEWIIQLSAMDHDQIVPIKHVKITVRPGPALNGGSVFIKTGNKISSVASPIRPFSIRFQMELAQKLAGWTAHKGGTVPKRFGKRTGGVQIKSRS